MKLPKTHIIETDRCRLRIVSIEDIPHVFSATRHAGFNDGMLWDPPDSIDDLGESYNKSVERWEQGKAYSFTIEEKESGFFVGRIDVRSEEKKNVWSVGFWTHPEKQGRGFASEALRPIIDLAFSLLGATRVEACYAVWNIASKRVLEKVGMSFVKHIPEGFMKNGVWVAEDLFAIDRNDRQ